MQIFFDKQSYERYIYQKELRKDANFLGILALILFLFNIVISAVTTTILSLTVGYERAFKDALGILIESGVISTICFFFISLIYALVRGLDFAKLFPFQKTGSKTVTMMVVVGLTITLMSNYVSDMVSNVFGMFGTNSGGGTAYSVDDGLSIAVYFFSVAVLPALVEEFTFRGVIMGSLRKYSDGMAILISSGLFALMHGNFTQIPFAFVGGLAFGYAAVKTNSLLPSILIHLFNNALAVLTDVLQSSEVLDVAGVNILWNGILLVLTIASILIVRNVIKKHPEWLKFSDSNIKIPYKEKVKTVCASPSIIAFAAVMMIYAVYTTIAL